VGVARPSRLRLPTIDRCPLGSHPAVSRSQGVCHNQREGLQESRLYPCLESPPTSNRRVIRLDRLSLVPVVPDRTVDRLGPGPGPRASAIITGGKLDILPWISRIYGMESSTQLDPSNRVVLTKALRQAAGISPRQKLKVTSTPGRIVLEAESDCSGTVAIRGKLKVWTGEVAKIPIDEAVEQARRYTR